MSEPRIELALGPVFFNWAPEQLTDFYARIADEAPVERVYVGEVICGKRSPLIDDALAAAAERLSAAGKQVVWSALALPTTPRERAASTRLVAETEGLVEINDMGGLLRRVGRAFVAGPLLNIYNESAAQELVRRGCERLCPPVEMTLEDIRVIGAATPGLELELFAFGRAPLALSGRCYHARTEGMRKDACKYVCDKDPDGMAVATLDGQDFLAVNGIQTLSHAVHVAAISPGELRRLGIKALRLSPHTMDMVRVAEAFRALADGVIDPAELQARLIALDPPGALVAGYLAGQPGCVAAVG